MSNRAESAALKASVFLFLSLIFLSIGITGVILLIRAPVEASTFGLAFVFILAALELLVGCWMIVQAVSYMAEYIDRLKNPPYIVTVEFDGELEEAWEQMDEAGLMTTEFDEVYRDDEDEELYLYLFVGTTRLDYKLKKSEESGTWEIYDYSQDEDRKVSVEDVKEMRATLHHLENVGPAGHQPAAT